MSSTNRIDILREELTKLGYSYEPVVFQGIEHTRFVSSEGLVWLYKDSNGRLPFPYVSANDVLNNKVVAADYAYQKGVRVPRMVRIKKEPRTLEEYRNMLGVGDRARIVIKPVDSTLSRGVSANVCTNEQLIDAIRKARSYSVDIIAQERIEGDEYRFIYVGTSLRCVIQKKKLSVVGDGSAAIRELIHIENQNRLNIKGQRVKYPAISYKWLSGVGVDLDEVLRADESRTLSDSTMIEGGASFYEVTSEIHQSYIRIANNLAKDFGGAYLAVDIIVDDHTTEAGPDNYAFLEFNDIPAPTHFYGCRNVDEVPVMRDLARYIDASLRLASRFE